MSRVTPENALKYAAWLASQHPGAFREVLRQVKALERTPWARQGQLGRLGDDSGLDTVTVSADATPALDFSNVDTSFTPDLSLTDIRFDPGSIDVSSGATDAILEAIAAAPTIDASVSDASQTSGGFWGYLSSGVSSLASSIGKVAGALVNPQTIGIVSGAAAAYFNGQAKTATAQAQAQSAAAIAQAQLQRVVAGAAPATIAYQTNPYTGQLVPVYQSNTGAAAVTPGLLTRLASPSTAGLSFSNPWVLGGTLALLIGGTLLAARR